jgi:hypothetical protein
MNLVSVSKQVGEGMKTKSGKKRKVWNGWGMFDEDGNLCTLNDQFWSIHKMPYKPEAFTPRWSVRKVEVREL